MQIMNLTPETVGRLVAAATKVRNNAHAPYSRFRVGAALLLPDGAIAVGCNVENASFGLSVCAERNAVAAALAAGFDTFHALAVVSESSPPATPCGACRQVLSEFGDFTVILANTANEQAVTSVAELLPEAFKAGDLNDPHTS